MLDDSTEENGATWIMPQSHKCDMAPSEDLFSVSQKELLEKRVTCSFLIATCGIALGKYHAVPPTNNYCILFASFY